MSGTQLRVEDGNGHTTAVITIGDDAPIAFIFGSGRHPDEQVHIRIVGSESKIRSRVGILSIGPDGLGIGRTPEAMDHQITVRRPGNHIAEVLAASPTRTSVGSTLVERKFVDDHLILEIGFPPHNFELEVQITNAPWAYQHHRTEPRPYKMVADDQIGLLILAIAEPALAGGEPRLRNEDLADVLGWSARTVSTVGGRAHHYFLGDPANGDQRRIARLGAFVIDRGLVTLEDVERDLHSYQQAKGLR